MLVTGDFNCNPDTSTYQLYKDYGFKDCYLDTGNPDTDDAFTFHAFQGNDYDASQHHWIRRVDWILVHDSRDAISSKSCAVARDNQHPLYPSDPYPVVAELLLEAVQNEGRTVWVESGC